MPTYTNYCQYAPCGKLFATKYVKTRYCSMECGLRDTKQSSVQAVGNGGVVTCRHGHLEGAQCGDCARERSLE